MALSLFLAHFDGRRDRTRREREGGTTVQFETSKIVRFYRSLRCYISRKTSRNTKSNQRRRCDDSWVVKCGKTALHNAPWLQYFALRLFYQISRLHYFIRCNERTKIMKRAFLIEYFWPPVTLAITTKNYGGRSREMHFHDAVSNSAGTPSRFLLPIMSAFVDWCATIARYRSTFFIMCVVVLELERRCSVKIELFMNPCDNARGRREQISRFDCSPTYGFLLQFFQKRQKRDEKSFQNSRWIPRSDCVPP